MCFLYFKKNVFQNKTYVFEIKQSEKIIIVNYFQK